MSLKSLAPRAKVLDLEILNAKFSDAHNPQERTNFHSGVLSSHHPLHRFLPRSLLLVFVKA